MSENTASAPRFTDAYIAANRIEFNTNDYTDGVEGADPNGTPYVMFEVADGGCACGCGEAVTNPKRNFRPGHDQRLMGILVRATRENLEVSWMQGGYLIGSTAVEYARKVLGDAGVAKLERYIATEPKRARKSGRTSAAQAAEVIAARAPAFTPGEVKIGRWVYPSRTFPNGAIVRNTKRDGSGEWIAV
jgi:hypothetical protein